MHRHPSFLKGLQAVHSPVLVNYQCLLPNSVFQRVPLPYPQDQYLAVILLLSLSLECSSQARQWHLVLQALDLGASQGFRMTAGRQSQYP